MAIALHDLKMILSSGATQTNTNPAASLGGKISTAAGGVIKSQTASAPVNITGITIADAHGNATGAGSLQYLYGAGPTKQIQWKPYGAVAFSSLITMTADGTYTVGGSNGYLILTVVYASLATSNKSDSITIGNNTNNLFDNVTASNSLLGKTSYRCIYLKNTHGTDTATSLKVWISTQTPAEDYFQIGLDPAGAGDGNTTGEATTIGTETTTPSGVSFSAPLTQATGLSIGTLSAGQCYALWLKRVVPAESRGTYIGNTMVLAFSEG